MSLIDAFLLDPAPFEVWIVRRTDGLKGSGTASDPYDGSTAARLDARKGVKRGQFSQSTMLSRNRRTDWRIGGVPQTTQAIHRAGGAARGLRRLPLTTQCPAV